MSCLHTIFRNSVLFPTCSATPSHTNRSGIPKSAMNCLSACLAVTVQIHNKMRKNQIVTAGRLVTVLDIRPNHRRSHLTTDSHTTTKRAALLTAPATATLILGLVPLPTYHMKDRNQAQTRSGMWHFYIYRHGHTPNRFDHQ